MPPALLRCLASFALLLPLLGAAAPEPLPEHTGLVVDLTGQLDDATQSALLRRLGALQNSGRAQVAILVAPGTQGLALADYSLQVAQHWKLGHAGKDDGMLIVVVPHLTAARIEVGYGLEASVPDVMAARWIDHVLLPALKQGQLAEGLHAVLGELESALPVPEVAKDEDHLLDRHPEWKLPFVLAIFSVFAIFPLFIGRWGSLLSAPMFAGMIGTAAWMLWDSQPATMTAGAVAFILPLLWGLNGGGRDALPPALVLARHVGNAAAVVLFFSLLMLFIGVGLSNVPEATWGAPLFAGTMALGLAAVLFPGRPAHVLMLVLVLRSLMHFIFILAFAYPALMDVVAEPTKVAFTIAGTFTALVALSLYMDSRETERIAAGEAATRWSLWIVGLALLAVVPVALLMFLQAALGADFHTRIAQAAAGGGSLSGVLWWAARNGFFAALKIGLGGRFGGGGAEGRG
jgi:uncharacterized protein